MWREYSLSTLKNNRSSSISILAGALIATLFLTFLCSLFYNLWADGVQQVVEEEGNWQGRMVGELTEESLRIIENFGNVKEMILREDLTGETGMVVDLILEHPGRIYRDLPLLAEQLGLSKDAVSYHSLLLSQYLIHDPEDPKPPLLLAFYLAVLILVSLSLVLIIHNSFAVSMNARIRQFGILSSIGATPGQIRSCLLKEALWLCTGPILLGLILGTGLSFLVIRAAGDLAEELAGRGELHFYWSPVVIGAGAVFSFLTVLFSAWLPALRLSKMPPLAAIRNTGELRLDKKKHSPFLSLLFGIEGELAGNALKAQKKALRTSALSLTLSFLGFVLILCFFTLSDISTRYTYFARYEKAWDVMAVLPDTSLETFALTEEVRELEGAGDTVVYGKTSASVLISQPDLSEELLDLGGLEMLAGDSAVKEGEMWQVNAPVVILDDQAFLTYCGQAGVKPDLQGTIVLNQIWDSLHSNFRYPSYVPFVKENQKTLLLRSREGEGEPVEVPVLGWTVKPPSLREEYADYTLVQFLPLSLWRELSGEIGGEETETYIRILGEAGGDLAEMNALEDALSRVLQERYKAETENRVQEKITNDRMLGGYKLILGGLCVLLALIGIANVFSNTQGFLGQRRQEFARYQSVGMTPGGMRKMFFVEALVIGGRPVLVTLPLSALILAFMLKKSYLDPKEFLAEAPVLPILAFLLAVFGCVALAYYLGGRKVMRQSLSEALRDDTV